MKVKLINYSQGTDEFESASALDLIAYCARVSNPSNQNNKETSEKLVKYLIKHKHWSPLEMVSACMEIETTRDIARQILRHRSVSVSRSLVRDTLTPQLTWTLLFVKLVYKIPRTDRTLSLLMMPALTKYGASCNRELLTKPKPLTNGLWKRALPKSKPEQCYQKATL